MMLILASNISRTYGSPPFQFSALRPTSLDIEQGEFVAIVGASGSGKSTLLNLLGLLDSPSSGRLFFEGRDCTTLGRDALARIRNRRIGYIFQQYHLLPRLSALHNVELPLIYAGEPRGNRRKRSEAALESVGLLSKADSLPAKLSGGEQQRVAVARALAADPAVLLADEPTGALDTASGQEVLRLIQQLHDDGRTIVMVTHDLHIASQAPRVIHMKDGAVVADENPVAAIFQRVMALPAAAAAFAAAQSSTRTVALLLGSVAAISLIVGGISIMNIMLVCVTERTSEIGLRLAIGARPRDIRRQFLVEAAALSTAGGLAGVALGSVSAWLVARTFGWPVLIQPATIVAAIALAAGFGVTFGWYPARRAATLQPVQALRRG